MSEIVIKAENVSKQYRLGQVGTGTLSHDINRLWYKVRGKEDPYLKIGEVNDRSQKGSSEYVWALKNINFEVKQGEALGVIGKNGAGKSTLLKILSRTTSPTTGNIKIRGRVASLLEVGTGFHPELSGRENIYLNGAILGMSRKEIQRKFDEIVQFAGVERYIETPVKRYSSGMYVRLAFAVAAHLEPEILIVDEVLAVGDAEFQKKCLGKMKDVSDKEGRTVLFVSHNMAAISSLCENTMLLEKGFVRGKGPSTEMIDMYFNNEDSFEGNKSIVPDDYFRQWPSRFLKIRQVEILDQANQLISSLLFKQPIRIRVKVEVFEQIKDTQIHIIICKNDGSKISNSNIYDDLSSLASFTKTGYSEITLEINPYLSPGIYMLTIFIASKERREIFDSVENFYRFEILPNAFFGNDLQYTPPYYFQSPGKWEFDDTIKIKSL